MRRAKRSAAVILLAGLAWLAGCSSESRRREAVNPREVTPVATITVKRQPVPDDREFAGTVKATLSSSLSSKVPGRVVRVWVHDGDEVTQGQLLLEVDPRELAAATSIAHADLAVARAEVATAESALEIEEQTSAAKVHQAESQVKEAEAMLARAKAQADLVESGPRRQELAQSRLAVVQADSSFKFAESELKRTKRLVEAGAVAERELEAAQNRYDLAKGVRDAAVQAESIALEGSRSQEVRSAKEGIVAATAAVRQARAGLEAARAARLQVGVRKNGIAVAKSKAVQAEAQLGAARATQSYTQIVAPFSGRIVGRMVDPGAMASPGVELIRIEGGAYRFESSVPEAAYVYLAKGSVAKVQIDALGSQPIDATVTETNPRGDETAHTFVVKLSLPHDQRVATGMFGRLMINQGKSSELLIPKTATWNREGVDYVYVVTTDDSIQLRVVKLGKTFGEDVVVSSGLQERESLVAKYDDLLRDGQKIRQVKR